MFGLVVEVKDACECLVSNEGKKSKQWNDEDESKRQMARLEDDESINK